ncbi:VWA domain-containing protein [Luteolibacter pohnpeiensis]|uniref:VWA domain-containing protein n=1 Tax=Luteolibacter pohnpeiensis TaxID=454153 RepID=A0A934VXA9_9BACT|nr:VWA domain-containing protein [Luteolibacter pohnpeiensis]MBK1883628.1 VWA domain-containing protein [Luteolibacter pohnpeiensis]
MLTNPLGLLALLGIPAVLAIHFLQRKSIELPVSTLFLLERTQRDAISGRRFDRLIPSVPLWMQLLGVLLLTWLLVEPRYKKENSVQRVAIVVDSSASMSVFRDDGIKRLTDELPAIQGLASAMEITVLESAPDRPRIYTGTSLDDMAKALKKWSPKEGMIDPTRSIRLARSLVSSEGSVIYLTDTPAEELPFEARLLSVGRPVENVGFTGITFANEQGALVWRAVVKNYGKSPATRTWKIVTADGSTEPASLKLAPGGITTIQAAFPTDAKEVRLELSPDDFPLDDCLPIVKPAPKPLTLFAATSPAFADLGEKLVNSLEATSSSNDATSADIMLATYDPLDPTLPVGNAIVFVEDSTATGTYLRGGILAEASPLMDGLNWQSLLVRETIQLDRQPTDQVLLWQEKRPLIFLRHLPATESRPAASQLFFNFDLRLSNVERQPAFIVLLHRFAGAVRDAKVAPASLNLETNQPVKLTLDPKQLATITQTSPDGKVLSKTSSETLPASFTTPPAPGFLTLSQADETLLSASLHFADTREADFTACSATDTLTESNQAAIDRHTKEDPYWRVWFILLIAAVLVAWKFVQTKSTEPTVASPVGGR